MGKYPLFDQYPGLNLPFVSLGVFPTPVQKLEGLSEHAAVFVKRDDLSGEEYGGNKVRKLEYVLGEAIQLGYQEVLTIGGAGSNHALATGIYAGKLGLQSHSILQRQHNARYVRENLLKSLYYGIQLIHCDDMTEMIDRAKELQRINRETTGRGIYEIPAGGSDPLGTVGFVNAAFELRQQVESGELPEPDVVYVAAGTLGTAAGLTVGFDLAGMKTKVMTVRVAGEPYMNEKMFVKLMDDTISLMHEADPSVPVRKYTEDDVHIVSDYYGGDYALFTEEGMRAITFMKDRYQISLDGTYTGKACAAMIDALRARDAEGRVFLFWNTLNSRPSPVDLKKLDYHKLPEAFHEYFEKDVQPLDR